jgi:phage N-6-adenine-methyltransferase
MSGATCRRQKRTRAVPAYHRHDKDEWATPRERFAEWTRRFGPFDLDAAATKENALCKRYFTAEQDGLKQDWGTGTVWVNPPYSEVALWAKKGYEASQAGATVVMLVASRTCTKWWHAWAMKAEIYFIKGRLRFEGAPNSAPFPSALLVFRPPKPGSKPKRPAHSLLRPRRYCAV